MTQNLSMPDGKQTPAISVILVETSDPGNIGAAARAMYTMGLTDLRLVTPVHFPHPKAVWRSKAAHGLVESAKLYPDLQAAIADCNLVVGASARMRAIPWPTLTPKALAGRVGEVSGEQRVGLVFGRENAGLTNEELQLCHQHCVIPGNPDYPVLNLSHAVQIICYEIFCHFHTEGSGCEYTSDQPLASQESIQNMLDALFTLLAESNFYHEDNKGKLTTRLRRFFMRAQPDKMEVNIWHGIAAHLGKLLKKTPID